MIGIYNQFNHDNYIKKVPTPQEVVTFPIEVGFEIDVNKVEKDSEQRIYNLINSKQDRMTQSNNIIDKIKKLNKQEEDEKQEDKSESEEKNNAVVRYFSDVNTFDIASKGVCRRCKKPGHYERWCVEDQVDVQQLCKYCLSPDHFHLRCPNNLCYKCNQFGHMAKDCKDQGLKCHRCNKRGHKSKQCYVIRADEENVFELDRGNLKQLKCLNCMQRGHLNCNKRHQNFQNDRLYQSELREEEYEHKRHKDQHRREHKRNDRQNDKNNNRHKEEHREFIDNRFRGLFESKKQKVQHKQREKYNNKQHHFYDEEEQSEYSMWSEVSPNTKRKLKNKSRKQNQKKDNKWRKHL